MAESNAPSRIPGWLKAAGSSIFGLISGAALMYLTPLVDSAIKPAEPVANFGYQAQGLAVTFQNRTANATDGWWDFGDGSALEPFSPQQATVTHAYAKPGSYIVKLNVHNLFNEKAERDVTVNLDTTGVPGPVIDSFKVEAVAGLRTPAVFRLTAEVKNADQLLWICGDSLPIEASREVNGKQERYVTIDQPGAHKFRLVAINSKQTVESVSSPQLVGQGPTGDVPMATLKVVYQAVHVDRVEEQAPVRLAWRHDCRDATCPASADWLARAGYQIVKAELDSRVKDFKTHGLPRIDVAPDGKKLTVSAELQRPAGLIAKVMPQGHVIPLKVTLEKRSAPTTKEYRLPMSVALPGQTCIPIQPMPNGWQVIDRTVTLDICEGKRVMWSGSLPVNCQMELQKHRMMVNAALQPNQLVLTVTSPVSGVPSTGN
jgi:hypothetical protein